MQVAFAGQTLDLSIEQLIVAGWTGRDMAGVQHHIDELAELGIAPPSQVPLYYRVSNTLLTQNAQIEVVGGRTSGEVEPLLIQHNEKLWLGIASDHTDRDLEAYSVAASKQACAKPIGTEVWDFDEIKADLDSLQLRCLIRENDDWVIYQDGTLAAIRPLAELMGGTSFGENTAMLCGTLGAIGGVRPAVDYRMELFDPVRDRKIALDYSVRTLPIVA